MDPPCHEFPQAHVGVRCESGGMFVIGGGGEGWVGVPIFKHHVPGTNE